METIFWVRNFSTDPEAATKLKIWQAILFFVMFPLLVVTAGCALATHDEEEHKPRQEFIPWDHMYRRTKVRNINVTTFQQVFPFIDLRMHAPEWYPSACNRC